MIFGKKKKNRSDGENREKRGRVIPVEKKIYYAKGGFMTYESARNSYRRRKGLHGVGGGEGGGKGGISRGGVYHMAGDAKKNWEEAHSPARSFHHHDRLAAALARDEPEKRKKGVDRKGGLLQNTKSSLGMGDQTERGEKSD